MKANPFSSSLLHACPACSLGQPKHLGVGACFSRTPEHRAACSSILLQWPASLSCFPEHKGELQHCSETVLLKVSKSIKPLRKAMAVTAAVGQFVPCLSEPFPRISVKVSHCCLTIFWLFKVRFGCWQRSALSLLFVAFWSTGFPWTSYPFQGKSRPYSVKTLKDSHVGRISSPSGCEWRRLALVLNAFVLRMSLSYPDENIEPRCLPVWWQYCVFIALMLAHPIVFPRLWSKFPS